MKTEQVKGVPAFECHVFAEKKTAVALLIPILNESGRIERQLAKIQRLGLDRQADVIILDGDSTDGSADPGRMRSFGVNTLLIKKGPGRQGAQLRMGFHFALQRGYSGFITMDGNNKDSVESIPLFLKKLDDGYDFVQGSRYITGGKSIRTPLSRHLAVRLIHAPLISLAAGKRFTDTTNAFRAYSLRYISHPDLQIFRDVFSDYELLAYLSVRATQLGLLTTEVPVTRSYPKTGNIPTKISPIKGNAKLLGTLIKTVCGSYHPHKRRS